jgi:predicted alpha/beta hydrolase family esterase
LAKAKERKVSRTIYVSAREEPVWLEAERQADRADQSLSAYVTNVLEAHINEQKTLDAPAEVKRLARRLLAIVEGQ